MNRKEQAKQITVDSVMLKMGYKPVNSSNTKSWYLSPFRGESHPSFVVNKRLNVWKDWGDQSKRGDVIALVMEMEGCTFSDALAYLLNDNYEFKKHDPTIIPIEETGIYICDVSPLTNKFLITYANSRGIDTELVRKYCSEVDFVFRKNPHIEHKAIGFMNDKGGFELRSEKHKVSNSPKTWTTIAGDTDNKTCDVFEGFFDFMSHLQWMGWDAPQSTTFVLNSLAYCSFIVDETETFNPVSLYFDNSAGADMYIEQYFTDSKYIVMGREIYPNHEDYNDFVKFNLLRQ